MTKLKTLKDLEECEGNAFLFASVRQLRQTAREWINLLEKDLAKEKEFSESLSMSDLSDSLRRHSIDFSMPMIQSKINWIRHFFNLEDSEDE